jgi:hypothetical protein
MRKYSKSSPLINVPGFLGFSFFSPPLRIFPKKGNRACLVVKDIMGIVFTPKKEGC